MLHLYNLFLLYQKLQLLISKFSKYLTITASRSRLHTNIRIAIHFPIADKALHSNTKIKLLKHRHRLTVVGQDRIDIRYITIAIRPASALHQSSAQRP